MPSISIVLSLLSGISIVQYLYSRSRYLDCDSPSFRENLNQTHKSRFFSRPTTLQSVMRVRTLSLIFYLECIVGSSIIGVEPSKQHLYQPNINQETGEESWSCLSDPTIILSYSQINDNYCDCPDGSDEPGTNSCSYKLDQKFYCKNTNHIPGYIENYKLNDGVCDYDVCCDGSDEYLTDKCPDKCSEIHQQFVKYKGDVSREVEKSLAIKNQIIENSSRIKNEIREKLNDLKHQLKTGTDVTYEFNDEFNSAIKKILEENGIVMNFRVDESELDTDDEVENVEPDEEVDSLSEISSYISSMNSKIDSQQQTINRLESILSNLAGNYNPNFNDLAVKESVNQFQEYFSNKIDLDVQEIDIQNVLQQIQETRGNEAKSNDFTEPTFGNMLSFYLNKFTQNDVEDEVMKSFNPSNTRSNTKTSNSKISDKEIKALEFEITLCENDLKADFGPDDILRSLQSVSITNKIGEYSYKIGLLNSIHQGNVLIGKYSHFEDNKLHFRNGDKCWNGPYRSGVVELICGSNHKLISVSEPEKCEYSFELISPIACQEYSDEDFLANFEINYDDLTISN